MHMCACVCGGQRLRFPLELELWEEGAGNWSCVLCRRNKLSYPLAISLSLIPILGDRASLFSPSCSGTHYNLALTAILLFQLPKSWDCVCELPDLICPFSWRFSCGYSATLLPKEEMGSPQFVPSLKKIMGPLSQCSGWGRWGNSSSSPSAEHGGAHLWPQQSGG